MPHVVSLDPSWGGCGYALCNEGGPLESGWIKLGTTWKWDTLAAFLAGPLSHLVVDAVLATRLGEPMPRVAVEIPAMIHRGSSHTTVRGVALATGPFLAWGVQPERLAYPWALEPRPWRAWWRITVRGRPAKKLAAVRIVQGLGWGAHLAHHPTASDDQGPRGDVAEAILIGVGAARHHADGPRGPAKWRYKGGPQHGR